MAEDLLQPKENNTLENIGCAYFDELVARSFFQPASTNRKLFIMHDLMRDLATFFAGKFYFKLKEFGNRCMIDNKTRHLSYATKFEDSIKLFREANNGAVHLRTFLDFTFLRHDQSIDIESDSWLLQQQLGCLRVLSFKHSSIELLSDSIGELILLRYLNLSDTPIMTLSESICNLYNLQTLKLRNCDELDMLPRRMEDLVNLRHLDIRGASRLKEMPKGMSKLKHLNFLSDYIVGEYEENGIRELETLDILRGSFCISKLENVKNSGEVLEAKMDGDIDDVQSERDILDKLQPHQNLKKLSIVGYRGETFPDWLGLSCYSNMTKLRLKRCKNCCELPSLGRLPFLRHLEFSDLDGLERIDFEIHNKKNGSFQQKTPFESLETLEITSMSGWREWHFPDEFDGFPKLRILSLKSCPVLRGDLPAHLPALEELTIADCEELACPLPRAPKLHQLLVDGSSTYFARVTYWSGDRISYYRHNIVISGTQLANSVLEWLPHIQPPRVRRLRIMNCESAISISGDYLPASKINILRATATQVTNGDSCRGVWFTVVVSIGGPSKSQGTRNQ
ncbi:putative disease resistance protein At3g14460 [Arachis ipaensis]|uniref:putative disease resistance protein At3g14460 n=1 Tax=Arachis ipaensis TaxID=130454 RepID=UPI000A2B83AE|nr:putative disease resistance protein At3g14460 [Arachis ipaensis]